eukprot:CAMPEP_0180333836 /NCGR_PEP_ID=MMETSP0988-20121125/43333_1 /TAXON_ID=697907 /ORGANISM="non described non described, Strain CCMP2293" /LENGTH=84 /DNA_ID=CAMNT_0022321685 /DNA_START=11 /DNA_END=261 /DNA_ORIENTATION=+
MSRNERWVAILAMLAGVTLLYKIFVAAWVARSAATEEDRDTTLWTIVQYMRARGIPEDVINDTKRFHRDSSANTLGFVDLEETA